MSYFIIEHPTRGTFVELDPETRAGGRFSLSGLRSDPETATRFATQQSAELMRLRLSPATGSYCDIRRSPDRGEVDWRVVA